MDASVAQYPDEYGQLAIEWALKLLKGEKPVMGTTVNDPGKPWSPMEFVNLPTGPALLLKPAVVPIEVSTYDEVLYSVRAFEAKKK
jgi:ABC-type sugar transport system substrate-binding protein